MRKTLTIIVLTILTLCATAQERERTERRFSPEQFVAELQKYITEEAGLTQQEAAKFFAVYKEMQEKQRALFDRQRELGRVKPADEQGCLKVIKESDEIDLELKRIQQNYHNRFVEMLSASKVYDILKAESRFHRRMMKNWGRGPRQQRDASQR